MSLRSTIGLLCRKSQEPLWLRGGFPRSFLATDEDGSVAWRKNFIRTFLERDLAALGFGLSPALMGWFWTMLAHYHGQLWNGSEMAASLGIAPNTARAYLDALEQTYMIRRLMPWQANLGTGWSTRAPASMPWPNGLPFVLWPTASR